MVAPARVQRQQMRFAAQEAEWADGSDWLEEDFLQCCDCSRTLAVTALLLLSLSSLLFSSPPLPVPFIYFLTIRLWDTERRLEKSKRHPETAVSRLESWQTQTADIRHWQRVNKIWDKERGRHRAKEVLHKKYIFIHLHIVSYLGVIYLFFSSPWSVFYLFSFNCKIYSTFAPAFT